MPLSDNFPSSPFVILEPDDRWVPDTEQQKFDFVNLVPPLVQKLRINVKEFRDSNYKGATQTSKDLLKWWFHKKHTIRDHETGRQEFRYYFAQQEAMETIIYLYDVAQVRFPQDLLQFDSSHKLDNNSFKESWLRFVVKMATGSGKTKIVSLAIIWSYFHKLYEKDSKLARNFLVISPNIIVLDRLYRDFRNGTIFLQDPSLPINGWQGKDWFNDFKFQIHKQDEINVMQKTGNIFLTNIHRVYVSKPPSLENSDPAEYFLGKKPKTKIEQKIDLGEVVRELDELMVFNDEAHHIHNEKLQWHKSIEDIHNRLFQDDKGGIALQIDTTATPKTDKGHIFPQVISDYPLVEAIAQNIVKQPIIPNKISQRKLREKDTVRYVEKYVDFIRLGVREWEKVSDRHKRMGKKAILFIMADLTENCDDIAEFIQTKYPHLKNKVLVIHTNKAGEYRETAKAKKDKAELDNLRKLANEIDHSDNPYEVVVSVLMLKEGWDVRNVTTIVGLRSFATKSNILPEQTLGRGLRRMYPEKGGEENVAVIGTKKFMEFVEEIKKEGVSLESYDMDEDSPSLAPSFVMIDKFDAEKDLEELDIKIPILSPRIYRNYNKIYDLEAETMVYNKIEYKQFSDDEVRNIDFHGLVDEKHKKTVNLDQIDNADYRPYLKFYVNLLLRDLHLEKSATIHNVFYGHVKDFVQEHLFDKKVQLDDNKTLLNTLANLEQPHAKNTIMEIFKTAINENTLEDKGATSIDKHIHVNDTGGFIVKRQETAKHILDYVRKSPFNLIIGDNKFEYDFAKFLDKCSDIISFTKNYYAISFKIDYVKQDGNISNYYPDFIVKAANNKIYIIETKGEEKLDDAPKWRRLNQWCGDVNQAQSQVKYSCLYVKQDLFEKYQPIDFESLVTAFAGEFPLGLKKLK